MKVLAFIGKHTKDDWQARLGWALVRLAQIGARFRRVTHVESLLDGTWDNASIASSSLRDGGVRSRMGVKLNPDHWLVIDVPSWDVDDAIDWFDAHNGDKYDWRGAMATVLWFLPHAANRYFCNEAVAIPHGVVDAQRLTPAAFIALCMSMPGARDVTAEFFELPEPV